MSAAQSNHDPALAHQQGPQQGPAVAVSATVATAAQPGGPAAGDLPSILGMTQDQVLSLLRTLPNVFTKLAEQGNLKEAAAETLSNLSQATFQPHTIPGQQPQQPPSVHTFQAAGPSGGMHALPITEPGPSSHPRGPPNLGQLALAAAAGGAAQMSAVRQGMQDAEEDLDDEHGEGGGQQQQAQGGSGGGRTRGTRGTMGSDEWARQRKDNHKEVERRRRGNINEGINELGRIVPNGSGEKAKGAILSRAVQYIHHLKENEARNIEKWTLEKLLMDQAMGDLQQQLEEMRRMWEEERIARQRVEGELDVLRSLQARGGAAAAAGAAAGAAVAGAGGSEASAAETAGGEGGAGEKRERKVERATEGDKDSEEPRVGKRQRTD